MVKSFFFRPKSICLKFVLLLLIYTGYAHGLTTTALKEADIAQLKPADLLTRWRHYHTVSRSNLEIAHAQLVIDQALTGDSTALEIYVKYLMQRVLHRKLAYWKPFLTSFLQDVPLKPSSAYHSYWMAQLHLLLNQQEAAIELLTPHSEAMHVPSMCELSALLVEQGIQHASQAATLAHNAQAITKVPCPKTLDPSHIMFRLALASSYPRDVPLTLDELKILESYVMYQNNPSINHQLKLAIALYKAKMYTNAMPLLQPLADTHNANAAYYLGNIHHYGLAGMLDTILAEQYYKIAIQYEHPQSYYELAQLYGEFSPFSADHVQRDRLYQKALWKGVEEAAAPVIHALCAGRDWHDINCQYLDSLFNKMPQSKGFIYLKEYLFISENLKRPQAALPAYLRKGVEAEHELSKLYAVLGYFKKRNVVLNRMNLRAISQYLHAFDEDFWFWNLCDSNPRCL